MVRRDSIISGFHHEIAMYVRQPVVPDANEMSKSWNLPYLQSSWFKLKKIKVIADFISNLSVSTALTPNKIPKLTFLPALQNDSKYDLNYLISMLN